MECLSMEIMSCCNKNIIVFVYKYPSSCFYYLFHNIENLHRNKNSGIYLCGDFNINLLDY